MSRLPCVSLAVLCGALMALPASMLAEDTGFGAHDRAARMIQAGIPLPADLIYDLSTSDAPEVFHTLLDVYEQADLRLGFTELRLSADAIAGRTVDAEIVFTTPVALPEGTIITLHQHWMDESRLQQNDPDHAAYATASATANLLPETVQVPAMPGGPGSLAAAPGFRVGAAGLAAGSRIRLRVAQFTLPKVAGYEFSLPVHVRLPGQARFRVPGNSLQIKPDEFSRISVTARSLALPGEDVSLRVRMEDQFGNLVQGRPLSLGPLSLDMRVNGVFRQRVELRQAVDGIPGVSFELPGVYQIELRSGGGGIRALSNPTLVGPYDRDLLWVDLGGTSRLSTGYLDSSALIERGAGYFDLVLPADHDAYLAGTAGFSVDQVAVSRQGEFKQKESGPGASDSVVRLARSPGETVDIAQPEWPTDLRRYTRDTLRLAQVVAGPGHHLWLGRKLADRGYPIGFVGSGYSRQFPGQHARVHTAVLAGAGGWFEAMRQGRTYVATGERILVLPGDLALDMDSARVLNFRIIGGGPIASVTLFKNGEPVEVRQGPELENGSYWLRLGSDSHPFSPILSLPRNAREWLGYISARDARLSVDEADGWQFSQQAGDGRIDFLTRTHGTMKQASIRLDTVTPDTVLETGIAPGFEDAAWLPSDRLPQPTPLLRFMIPVAEARAGTSRLSEVAGYGDRLQLMPARAPLAGREYDFHYQDDSTPRKGDYYFLMVRQQNGAMAYSSPLFIGI